MKECMLVSYVVMEAINNSGDRMPKFYSVVVTDLTEWQIENPYYIVLHSLMMTRNEAEAYNKRRFETVC
ncbi:MAG: hypothetical protein ABH884_00110 [Candidatus Komeilibacteria bacterium]